MVYWMMYGKIQEHKRNGLNKSQTMRRLGIDYKTILKYWDMEPDEYTVSTESARSRTKKADKYKAYVVMCLEEHPDMSSAQLYDWIREKTKQTALGFQKRAFRDYVKAIRKEYGIKKPARDRQYEAVRDLPPGYQAQVDMGEILLETPAGRRRKIYCFAMVLSYSRQKYIRWQERPFTTDTLIQAHICAFSFYGGRPKEIVYDQDKVLAVSENHGDIIYTEGFQSYVSEVKFDVFLCHAWDPESKGRIESVVKYAKHGFAEHRMFHDIDSFNADCIAWLLRTGNAEAHGTTKQIPAALFSLEKEYLLPVSEYSFTVAANKSISYQVRKDNIVLYKGNRYRVPKGTYSSGKRCHVEVDGQETLLITDMLTGDVYAKHPLCHEKGMLIGQKRGERDKSSSLLKLEESVKRLFGQDELILPFLEHIHQDKPRYYRDQLGVIKKLFTEWNSETIIRGLHYCSERELYSAGELKSSILYLDTARQDGAETLRTTGLLPARYQGGNPDIRDLRIYEEAMGGGVFHG